MKRTLFRALAMVLAGVLIGLWFAPLEVMSAAGVCQNQFIRSLARAEGVCETVLIDTDTDKKFGGVAVTATGTEINKLAGVVAGTTTASKAVVVGSNKELDVLAVADLKLGAGAGTSVTATAAELNKLAGVVDGTTTASKALVVGANKEVDVLALPVSGLKIGAGAGTAVDRTAAEINNLVQGLTAGIKVKGLQHTTATAADTVATGLATVTSCTATLEADPGDDPFLVSCQIGDQAGAPAAGSIVVKTWKHDGTDPTPTAAATFSKKVNVIVTGT